MFSSLRPLVLAALAALAACAEPADPQAPAQTDAPGPRALVTHDGGTHVILRSGAELALAHGPTEQLADEYPVVVRRGALPEGLTSDELRWQGRQVLLHGPHGVACVGVVDEVQMLGRFHMGDHLRADWYDDDGNPRLAPEAFAAAAFEQAPSLGSVDLVGRVSALSGDCSEALWAQLADDSAPATATAEPAPADLHRLALEAARATEAYQNEQAAYEAFKLEAPTEQNTDGFPARWEDYNSLLDVTLIAHPNGETLVVASIQAGEGCGDFSGSFSMLWRLQGDTLDPVPSEALTPGVILRGATDVDGDGNLDLLTSDGYILQTRGGFDKALSSDLPDNNGCGC